MEKIQRIGISLEGSLLDKFDELIHEKNYPNRSEAVRDLIREKLSGEKLQDPETEAVAAVHLVYDHHQTQLTEKLIRIQHSHLLKTISSMHVHIGHHECLEVILLRGKVREITRLGDQIVSLKGVTYGKINLIAAEEFLSEEEHSHGHDHRA
ncbi:Putative nickel-responsive regulator [Anaerohalosphaera lusitana]|uniref:Putative nickel-responsive regulator n=1 Tax=Anaerohalosphaera lusitana TaxID=1936003 RepID=A0A1U9NGX9_9BACT|nr:nickel-responsive transcriptional regulator NikR [Anaerohalosphaera lusitana]AQT67017.1 Putative nickel-responsive regulator [Anaerohalosphaera lusitana]